MRLSENDLKQLDAATLNALEVEPLRVLAVILLDDLKEARDRLRQDPSNSSRPPASRAPWEYSGGSDSPAPQDDEAQTDGVTDREAEPRVPAKASIPADTHQGNSEKPAGKPGKPHGAPGSDNLTSTNLR
jgi:hypothetical protein